MVVKILVWKNSLDFGQWKIMVEGAKIFFFKIRLKSQFPTVF